ncbi:MAG: hypothetical protein KJ578_06920 [Bacteroidetes bacterium]|nr:hypothetical protein [Bacteroidota bacterium]
MPKCCDILLRLLVLLPALSIAQSFENGFEINQNQAFWYNTSIKYDSTAFAGKAFNLAAADQEFGLAFQIPSKQLAHTSNSINLMLEAWLRFDQPAEKAFYVLTINNADELLLWHAFDLTQNFSAANEWFHFADSISIPADLLQNSSLKIYLWNPSKITISTDQIIHVFQEANIPTYIPDSIDFPEIEGIPTVLAQNRFFELLHYPESGALLVADNRGKPITKPWTVFTQMQARRKSVTSLTSQWKIRSSRSKNDKTRLVLVAKNTLSRNKIHIDFEWGNPQLSIEMQSRFRKSGLLDRQALVIAFEDSLNQVFRKNRLIDSVDFQKAYYLDHQGFICGKADRSSGIYPASQLSSLQFDQKQNSAFLNLDFAADHPLIHYPLRSDTTDYFVDQSATQIKARSKIDGTFELLSGFEPPFLPRIMPVSHGFRAAIAFTEHADWTNLRTQRAVNFGHEDITQADSAVGGFVFYDIPVTKSVFYNNPDGITNAVISDSIFTEPHASIVENRAFYEFLNQLYVHGHEICLHSPEQFSSTRQNLKSALQFMEAHFGSPSWIDHGYNNLPMSNRENLVGDGLRKSGALSVLKHGGRHGVRYFWNPYFEEVIPFQKWHFDGQLLQPYSGFSDAFPERNFSAIPGTDAWIWRTNGTLEIPREGLWNYYFNNERLSRLIKFNGIYIGHVYPAWVQEQKGFWHYDETGKIVAETGFNQALARIDSLHKSRELLPATLQQLLRYHEQSLQIVYDFSADGTVRITHMGDQPIAGLSFVTTADAVVVEKKEFESRHSGGELLFWFNLQPGETVSLKALKALTK